MKASMSMTVDTLWGNAVTLQIEAELDNSPDHIPIAELMQLGVYRLSIMAAEVRRHDQRTLTVRDGHDGGQHERQAFNEMERTQRADDPRGE